MRLDGFLAHRGFGTRSEVRDLIRRGVVAVDRRVQRDPAVRLATTAEVTVRGEAVPWGLESATLIYHKPVGLACSHDPDEAPLVYDQVSSEYAQLGLESAGRLDRDTSGLLILTTDGQLVHRLTNPKRHLPKRYRIRYRGELSAHAVPRCAKGLVIEGDPKPTLPAQLVLQGPVEHMPECHLATLILSEGRYHQVRKMIAALGGTVEVLHRDAIGQLELPLDLLPGAMRPLSDAELTLLTSGATHPTPRPDEPAPAREPLPGRIGQELPPLEDREWNV